MSTNTFNITVKRQDLFIFPWKQDSRASTDKMKVLELLLQRLLDPGQL